MSLRLAGQLDLGGAISGTRSVAFTVALSISQFPTGSEPRTDATIAYARTTTLSMPARTTTLSLPSRTTSVVI